MERGGVDDERSGEKSGLSIWLLGNTFSGDMQTEWVSVPVMGDFDEMGY